jgi:hypothetical protein
MNRNNFQDCQSPGANHKQIWKSEIVIQRESQLSKSPERSLIFFKGYGDFINFFQPLENRVTFEIKLNKIK